MLEELVKSVCAAAEGDDLERLNEFCAALIVQLPEEPGAIEVALARKTLKALRSSRRFDQMRRVANAFLVDGCEDAVVVHFLAQGMIEAGEILPAIRLLENSVEESGLEVHQWGELKGALGRAWKDLAVQTRDRRHNISQNATRESFRHYNEAWAKDASKFTYQGVNMIAVANWDERQGEGQQLLAADEHGKARLAAQSIVEELTRRPSTELKNWDYATLGEAFLGTGNHAEARKWYGEYIKREDSAFALAGTARQLHQLWNAGAQVWGEEILAPMIAKLCMEPGPGFSFSPRALEKLASVPRAQHEAILGELGAMTYSYLQKALDAAKSVALIFKNGRPHGTGFAVKGRDLDEKLGDEIVVLTNAHVVSDRSYPDAASLTEATVKFELLHRDGEAEDQYDVAEVYWESHPDEHDVAVLRLRPAVPAKLKPRGIYDKLPEIDAARKRQIYIIGHPSGREVSFSFQDNELLDYEREVYHSPGSIAPCRIHYRAPTERGSSGSPVYDESWRIIGIHHAGGRYVQKLDGTRNTHAANEGLWIESMRRALQKEKERGGQ